jgi:hypothetical protein
MKIGDQIHFHLRLEDGSHSHALLKGCAIIGKCVYGDCRCEALVKEKVQEKE